MKVTAKILYLKQAMVTGLVRRGVISSRAARIVEPYLEAELAGKATHGVSKFFTYVPIIVKTKETAPRVIKARFNYALIDARQELGHFAATAAVGVLLRKARRYGNATVGVKNASYYAMAGTYAKMIADAGFVAIVLNNGGPAAVAPFGGTDPIFGTNPIAIGLPTSSGPIVLDMATSKKTWGEINLARVEERQLPKETFYDQAGRFTRSPHAAVSVKAFDEHKGYGLNFMFEVLTGAFVGANMGLQSQNAYDLGFLFMAFSPSMFTSGHRFAESMRQLVKEIKASKKLPGVRAIYLPGERSEQQLKNARRQGTIEIPERMYKKLLKFAKEATFDPSLPKR